MSVPSWATLILAACIVCGEGRLLKHHSINHIDHNAITKTPFENHRFEDETKRAKNSEESLGLKVGRTINLFPRYGSLTLTLRVSSSKDGDDDDVVASNWGWV